MANKKYIKCSIDGCDKNSHYTAQGKRGWCGAHYHRWYQYGDPLGAAARITHICSIVDCDKPHDANGFCSSHGHRLRRYGDPLGVPKKRERPTCRIESCDRLSRSKGLCGTHYERQRLLGDALAIVRPQALRGNPIRWLREQIISPGKECIPWPFGFDKTTGYGTIRFNGKSMPAHRVALILATSKNPKHFDAAHQPIICHNPACVNVNHIRWATRAENAHDTTIDESMPRGEKHHNNILTEEDIHAIRKDNRTNKTIAANYGVSSSTISGIKNGYTWAWLK